ncbi:hypothetical protein CMEL01_02659 [Colletotrichum melonis]|uniref:Uncharacterized protein n=1 Tax=Colletotrichum melonis TaxID=1209925 RepID=A0AAI9UN32_9PEZI|nr:hypothetical protein CMEL01_02659 [Colletotrichum melonis]
MKKRKNRPVRRPPTPTLTVRPRARPRSGTRSSPLSIQQPLQEAALLAEDARATRVLHSRVSRISIINQGGICSSFREPRVGRIL